MRGTPSPPRPSSSSGRRGHERFREIFLGSRPSAGLDLVFVDEPLIFLFFFLLSAVFRRLFSPPPWL